VTVKLWLTVLGASSASVAVHVTVVVPMAKVEPEAGAQPIVAAELSPASSIAVGSAYVTAAPLGLVALVVMLADPPVIARSVSSTVMVKLWLTVLGASSPSVAVHVTVLVPMAKVEPDAGAQLAVAAGLSPASSTA